MRIDSSKSTIIIAPNKELSDIVRQFSKKSIKSDFPWNIILINARIGQTLKNLMPITNASLSTGAKNFLVVLQHAEDVPQENMDSLIEALRISRHHGLAYALGYRSPQNVPEKIKALTRINLFPVKPKTPKG